MDSKDDDQHASVELEVYTFENGEVSGPHSSQLVIDWAIQGGFDTDLKICPSGSEVWITLRRNPSPESKVAKIIPLESGGDPMQSIGRGRPKQSLVICLSALLAGLVGWGAKTMHSGKPPVVTATAPGISPQPEPTPPKPVLVKDVKAEKQLEETIAEITSLRAEVKNRKEWGAKLSSVAGDLAKRLERISGVINAVSDIEQRVSIDVTISNKLLIVDKKAIEARLRHEFSKAGFTIVSTNDPMDHAMVFAGVEDIVINEKVNAAYMLDFTCCVTCVLGGSKKILPVYNKATIGYAGINSNYATQIRNFFENELIKGIAELDRIEGLVKAGRDRVKTAEELLAEAGVPPEPAVSNVGQFQVKKGGSGVLISKKPLILTNYHVVSDCSKLRIYFKSKPIEGSAKVVEFDRDHDLALIAFPTSNEPLNVAVAPLTPAAPAVGTEIYTLGFPLNDLLGNSVKFSSGTISSATGMRDEIGQFQHSAPTQPGNSGGPVFLKSGHLCGLVVSTMDSAQTLNTLKFLPQNVNYAINSETMRAFLGKAGVSPDVPDERRVNLTIEEAQEITVRIEGGN